jgi:hypothetical protein
MRMEEAVLSAALITLYQTTQHNIPEDTNLHTEKQKCKGEKVYSLPTPYFILILFKIY